MLVNDMEQIKHKRVKVLHRISGSCKVEFTVSPGILCTFGDQWDEFVWAAVREDEGWVIISVDCGLSVGGGLPTVGGATEQARGMLASHTTQEVTSIIEDHNIPPYKYWKDLKVGDIITEEDIKRWRKDDIQRVGGTNH